MVVDLPPRFARGPDCMNIHPTCINMNNMQPTLWSKYKNVVFTLQLLDPMLPGLNFLFG